MLSQLEPIPIYHYQTNLIILSIENVFILTTPIIII